MFIEHWTLNIEKRLYYLNIEYRLAEEAPFPSNTNWDITFFSGHLKKWMKFLQAIMGMGYNSKAKKIKDYAAVLDKVGDKQRLERGQF